MLQRSIRSLDRSVLRAETFEKMIAHAQGICDNRESRIHRATGYEETAIHYVKILQVVRAAVEVQNRGGRIFAEFTRADLVTQAMHGHFRGEVARFWREIIHLRHNVAAAADFLENAFPTLGQPVERLTVVLGVVNYYPLVALDRT